MVYKIDTHEWDSRTMRILVAHGLPDDRALKWTREYSNPKVIEIVYLRHVANGLFEDVASRKPGVPPASYLLELQKAKKIYELTYELLPEFHGEKGNDGIFVSRRVKLCDQLIDKYRAELSKGQRQRSTT